MTIAGRILAVLFALLIAAPAFAQAPQRSYSRAELDQMLAPVALYPDALLSQVLMAATYPAEVNEASRWTRANPGLQGDEAVRAVQNQDWDPSVMSLVAFPQVLQRMEEAGHFPGIVGVEPFDYVPDGPGCAAHSLGYLRGVLQGLRTHG